MSVIGIDLGTDGIYVGNIIEGSVAMFVGETGSRCTPTFLTFGEKKRTFGKDSKLACLKENSMVNTIHSVKRFIGLKYSELDKSELEYLPISKIVQGKNDEILFEVKHLGKTEFLTPVQILGSIFGNISRDYNKTNKRKGKIDAVIAVPPYFCDRRRRAVADAARIGSINPIQIITDISAVSVLRGIRMNLKEKEKENLILVDVGAGHTTIANICFTDKVCILENFVSDKKFGVRVFEKILFDFFVKYIKEKYKLDVSTNLRARLKLYESCEKIKKNLSQNKKVSYFMESFMNDIDVNLMITREEFLKLAEPNLQDFRKLLKDFLKNNKIDLKKIAKVEMIGGGSYIPYVKKIVEDLYKGHKCWTTMNAVESVAQGCSLQGAIISPAYNIKKGLIAKENFPTPIKLGWWSDSNKSDKEGWNKTTNLFGKKDKFPIQKDVSFKRNQDFKIILMYDSMEPFADKLPKTLGSFKIKKVPKEKKDVTIRIGMDDSGLIDVKSAWYKYDKEIEEKVEIKEEPKKEKKKNEKKGKKEEPKKEKTKKEEPKKEETKKEEPKKEETKKEEPKKEETKKEEKPKEEKKDAEGDVKMEDKKQEKKKEKKKEKKYKIVKKTVTFTENLELEKDVPQLTNQQLNKFKNIEEKFVSVDKLEEETAMVRDNIEREAYEIMDKMIEGELLHDFIDPEKYDELEMKMQDAIDWVYGDGENQTKEVYVKKFNEMMEYLAPIKRRCTEYNAREKLLETLTNNFKKYEDFVSSKDEKYSHIGEDERKKVANKVNEVRKWLATELSEQSKLKKYQDPVLTISILTKKNNEMIKECQPIMNKVKPAPKPKKEEKKDEKKKKEEKKDEKKKKEEKKDEKKKEEKKKEEKKNEDVKMEDKKEDKKEKNEDVKMKDKK